jgi:hypothetical protein
MIEIVGMIESIETIEIVENIEMIESTIEDVEVIETIEIIVNIENKDIIVIVGNSKIAASTGITVNDVDPQIDCVRMNMSVHKKGYAEVSLQKVPIEQHPNDRQTRSLIRPLFLPVKLSSQTVDLGRLLSSLLLLECRVINP